MQDKNQLKTNNYFKEHKVVNVKLPFGFAGIKKFGFQSTIAKGVVKVVKF
jgi:hypothetical protein